MCEQMLVEAGANKKSKDRDDRIPFDCVCDDKGAGCSAETRAALTELLRV